MSRYNKDLGDFGENAAENFLKKNGYKILERNFLTKGGEADIIALDDKTLVFIEVKTRSSLKFGLPAEAVNKRKINHMRRAAEWYIFKNPTDFEIRFDIIEIIATISDGLFQLSEINHIKNIIID